MSKALEAAAEVIWLDYGGAKYGGGHFDPSSQLVTVVQANATAKAAISAYLAHLAEDAQGPLSAPELMMREAIWVELGAAVFDVPVEQLNRAVRASYLATLRTLAGKE